MIVIVALLSLLAGCSPVGAPEALLAPQPSRDGLEGRDGPFGAAVVDLAVQARVVGVVPTLVVYPADDELAPAVEGAPVVGFTHGGFVEPERYLWLARHLATRGYVTVLPRADSLLALTQPANASLAIDAVRAESAEDGPLAGLLAEYGPVAAMGHSLGGVVAARQWTRDPSIQLLVMLASYPAGADPVEEQVDRPVISIVGATDQGIDAIEEAFGRYPGPSDQRVIGGMNHYAWTDDATDGELARDGLLVRPLKDVRLDALRIVDAYLDVWLIEGDPRQIEGKFPGTLP